MLYSGTELELVPEKVFHEIELSEILRSLESLLNCVGFSDTFKLVVSLISSCWCLFLGYLGPFLKKYQFLLDEMYLKYLENSFPVMIYNS